MSKTKMDSSLRNYQRKLREKKQDTLAKRLLIVDYLVFLFVSVRYQMIFFSADYYKERVPYRYRRHVNPTDPFDQLCFLLFILALSLTFNQSTDPKKKYLTTFQSYLLPVIIFFIISALSVSGFNPYLTHFPVKHIYTLLFDFYSLYVILLIYGIIRVFFSSNYQINCLADRHKFQINLGFAQTFIYIVTFFIAMIFPFLLPPLY